ERQRTPARPAPELEDRAVGLECNAAPERHVAPPKRPRVLPVVERRVVVPALPTFFITRGSAPNPGSVARGGPCAPLRFLALTRGSAPNPGSVARGGPCAPLRSLALTRGSAPNPGSVARAGPCAASLF